MVEYQKDISTNPTTAQTSYYMAEMGYRCKQLVIELSNNGVVIQADAMQWLAGNIQTRTNIKGVGDFAKAIPHRKRVQIPLDCDIISA